MRRDELYLKDIIDAAEAIERFIGKKSHRHFLDDEILQSAVLQKLIVIGEAAGRTSKDFRGKHPNIEWEAIAAFRNIAVHEYFAVNWEIVWNTATGDVPAMRKEIKPLL